MAALHTQRPLVAVVVDSQLRIHRLPRRNDPQVQAAAKVDDKEVASARIPASTGNQVPLGASSLLLQIVSGERIPWVRWAPDDALLLLLGDDRGNLRVWDLTDAIEESKRLSKRAAPHALRDDDAIDFSNEWGLRVNEAGTLNTGEITRALEWLLPQRVTTRRDRSGWDDDEGADDRSEECPSPSALPWGAQGLLAVSASATVHLFWRSEFAALSDPRRPTAWEEVRGRLFGCDDVLHAAVCSAAASSALVCTASAAFHRGVGIHRLTLPSDLTSLRKLNALRLECLQQLQIFPSESPRTPAPMPMQAAPGRVGAFAFARSSDSQGEACIALLVRSRSDLHHVIDGVKAESSDGTGQPDHDVDAQQPSDQSSPMSRHERDRSGARNRISLQLWRWTPDVAARSGECIGSWSWAGELPLPARTSLNATLSVSGDGAQLLVHSDSGALCLVALPEADADEMRLVVDFSDTEPAAPFAAVTRTDSIRMNGHTGVHDAIASADVVGCPAVKLEVDVVDGVQCKRELPSSFSGSKRPRRCSRRNLHAAALDPYGAFWAVVSTDGTASVSTLPAGASRLFAEDWMRRELLAREYHPHGLLTALSASPSTSAASNLQGALSALESLCERASELFKQDLMAVEGYGAPASAEAKWLAFGTHTLALACALCGSVVPRLSAEARLTLALACAGDTLLHELRQHATALVRTAAAAPLAWERLASAAATMLERDARGFEGGSTQPDGARSSDGSASPSPSAPTPLDAHCQWLLLLFCSWLTLERAAGQGPRGVGIPTGLPPSVRVTLLSALAIALHSAGHAQSALSADLLDSLVHIATALLSGQSDVTDVANSVPTFDLELQWQLTCLRTRLGITDHDSPDEHGRSFDPLHLAFLAPLAPEVSDTSFKAYVDLLEWAGSGIAEAS